jgi:hypothetical protein
MTASGAERLPEWDSGDDFVPAEELARRQGVRPVASIEELAMPEAFESDEEHQQVLDDLYASRRAEAA